MREVHIRSLGWEDPLVAWQPTPVCLSGECLGQRSTAGYTVHKVGWSDLNTHTHAQSLVMTRFGGWILEFMTEAGQRIRSLGKRRSRKQESRILEMVFKVRSLAQWHQWPLGTCWKCWSLGCTLDLHSQNSECKAQQTMFYQALLADSMILTFESFSVGDFDGLQSWGGVRVGSN